MIVKNKIGSLKTGGTVKPVYQRLVKHILDTK